MFPQHRLLLGFLNRLTVSLSVMAPWGFPVGSMVKDLPAIAGIPGDSVSGSGRSPGEGNVNPLQYSCLGNPMDGGAWRATVHGVMKRRTRLSDSVRMAPYQWGRAQFVPHRFVPDSSPTFCLLVWPPVLGICPSRAFLLPAASYWYPFPQLWRFRPLPLLSWWSVVAGLAGMRGHQWRSPVYPLSVAGLLGSILNPLLILPSGIRHR